MSTIDALKTMVLPPVHTLGNKISFICMELESRNILPEEGEFKFSKGKIQWWINASGMGDTTALRALFDDYDCKLRYRGDTRHAHSVLINVNAAGGEGENIPFDVIIEYALRCNL